MFNISYTVSASAAVPKTSFLSGTYNPHPPYPWYEIKNLPQNSYFENP